MTFRGLGDGFRAGFRISFLACVWVVSGLSPALALVPAPGGGPNPNPNPPPQIGPGSPYISGRFAGTQPVASPPPGAVVPDDFCLPGKLDDCGDHLREQPDANPFVEPETVVFGDPDLAFAEARNSVWVDGRFRLTQQTTAGETLQTDTFTIGGDHRFGDRFLLGVMVVQSNNTLTQTGPGIVDSGSGMLYGPYFAFELSETWAIDGRYIVGDIAHDVETGGVFTGQYQSRETYGALRLAAEFPRGNWRLLPSVELAVLTRDDDAYIDGVRGPVAARSSTQTFVTGAVLAYYDGLNIANGALTPYAGLEASQLIGSGSPFGTLRAGLSFAFANGGMLNVDYAYGAIGLAGVNDQLLTIKIEIPF